MENIAGLYRREFSKSLTKNIYGPEKRADEGITYFAALGTEYNNQMLFKKLRDSFPCQDFDKCCFPLIKTGHLQQCVSIKIKENINPCQSEAFVPYDKCEDILEINPHDHYSDDRIAWQEKSEILCLSEKSDASLILNKDGENESAAKSDIALAFLLKTLIHLKGKKLFAFII